ncbi:hypothetical protein AAE478_004169 [Parahypoxylon ruwenzoriense]
MCFPFILFFFALLAWTSNAAVLPRIDPYVGDLRTFSTTGCFANNQGVGTFTESMTGICNLYPEQFSSIYIHITAGWIFRAYTDQNCHDNGTIITGTPPGAGRPIVCNNQIGPAWVAYSVRRPESATPAITN